MALLTKQVETDYKTEFLPDYSDEYNTENLVWLISTHFDYDTIKKREPFLAKGKSENKIKARELNENLEIEILGKTHIIPSALRNLHNEIKDSQKLLDLKEGWDEEHALPISFQLYEVAINFLISYAIFIFENYRQMIISTPEINPCKDGSIDLSWRTQNARLLINIRSQESEILAFYYGDLYKDRMPTKGNVSTGVVQEHLAVWMKNII